MSTVIVSLYETATLKRLLGRPQRFRWRAIADNGEVLASGEAYVNRSDALSAIEKLFGNQSTVHLRELDHGSRVLRVPTAA
jgi:uncharacterized protein YegP (UPF0339 family)